LQERFDGEPIAIAGTDDELDGRFVADERVV
jgi:hypothetical protein